MIPGPGGDVAGPALRVVVTDRLVIIVSRRAAARTATDCPAPGSPVAGVDQLESL